MRRRHLGVMDVPAGTLLTMPMDGSTKMRKGSGGGVTGRGLHSSTFKLNLSRF